MALKFVKPNCIDGSEIRVPGRAMPWYMERKGPLGMMDRMSLNEYKRISPIEREKLMVEARHQKKTGAYDEVKWAVKEKMAYLALALEGCRTDVYHGHKDQSVEAEKKIASEIALIGKDAVPALMEILHGKLIYQWPCAAYALGMLESEEAVPRLVEMLEQNAEDHHRLRGAAIEALVSIGKPSVMRAFPTLVDVLRNSGGARADSDLARALIDKQMSLPERMDRLLDGSVLLKALAEKKMVDALVYALEKSQMKYEETSYDGHYQDVEEIVIMLREIRDASAVPAIMKLDKYSGVTGRALYDIVGKAKAMELAETLSHSNDVKKAIEEYSEARLKAYREREMQGFKGC